MDKLNEAEFLLLDKLFVECDVGELLVIKQYIDKTINEKMYKIAERTGIMIEKSEMYG